MKRTITILTICFVQSIYTYSQDRTIIDTISDYFQEIKSNTKQHIDLWDIDLYGPILMINPFTREVYANYPDEEGVLKQDGTIYTGILPKEVLIANTAIEWKGKKWTMIILPYVSENINERLKLFSHELFHLSQPVLGFDFKSFYSNLPEDFDMTSLDNSHLDKRDGRIYLRLELNALLEAIKSKDNKDTKTHLKSALIFRKYRYALFPDAALSENILELNEGLAEYTGIIMSHENELETEKILERLLSEFEQYPTFTNTFAYITIPLYGYILSRNDKYWNKRININTNLTDYFMGAFEITLPNDIAVAVSNISRQYNGEIINIEEFTREKAIEKRVEEYKSKFLDLPHLIIYGKVKGFSFDTRYVTPLENYGTVYQIMQISDTWGKLTVTRGALIGTDRDRITVSEPIIIDKEKVTGDGWTLEINERFIIKKNSIDGNYILMEE